MEAIDVGTIRSYIERLETILGREWCDKEIEKYHNFRGKYSPLGMWSHRHPTTSPIIPLLFQYRHPEYWKDYRDTPLGYWYGNPLNYLQELAVSIFQFEGFWSKIPKNASG